MVEKKIQINALTDKEKAYLLGMIEGDGYLYYDKWGHYKTNIYLNSKKDLDIVDYILSLLNKMKSNPYIMNKQGCFIIRVNSKQLYTYLKNELNNISQQKNNDFILGFISGFIDSDGHVSYGDIVISNKNKKLIKIAENLCKKINIKTNLRNQNNLFERKVYNIWRLRISTSFKYEKHISKKINRIYGGGYPS